MRYHSFVNALTSVVVTEQVSINTNLSLLSGHARTGRTNVTSRATASLTTSPSCVAGRLQIRQMGASRRMNGPTQPRHSAECPLQSLQCQAPCVSVSTKTARKSETDSAQTEHTGKQPGHTRLHATTKAARHMYALTTQSARGAAPTCKSCTRAPPGPPARVLAPDDHPQAAGAAGARYSA
jgi:hypothetical protein